jgi:hypothetical protein
MPEIKRNVIAVLRNQPDRFTNNMGDAYLIKNVRVASFRIREPEPLNILTAMAENERVVKTESDPGRKAIALAWLLHLVGDIHPCTRCSYSRLTIPKETRWSPRDMQQRNALALTNTSLTAWAGPGVSALRLT